MHDRFFMHLRFAAHLGLFTALAGILVAWNSVGAPRAVRVEVDGVSTLHPTRQMQVGRVLREAGVSFGPNDFVDPPPSASLGSRDSILIKRVTSFVLTVDGSTSHSLTAGRTVGEVLRDAGVAVGPRDLVTLSGRPVRLDSSFPRPSSDASRLSAKYAYLRHSISPEVNASPPDLAVRHARTLYAHDRGWVVEVQTLQQNIGQALQAAGVGLRQSDLVQPDPESPVQSGLHVYIKRANQVHLSADGSSRLLHTFAPTVGDLLQGAGLRLEPGDRVEPGAGTPLREGLTVAVIRVNEERVTVDELLPFQTEYVADDTMEIGQQQVVQQGTTGLRHRTLSIVYENGVEVRRTLEREWTEREPERGIVRYGTRAVEYSVETDAGLVRYSRKMRVWATYYTPASAGKPPGSPGYGVTSTGMQARRGIIAVDPRAIPYFTRIYVPGYGLGIAADTGSGIAGAHIDLAFGDDEYPAWSSRWVDIYLLD